MCSGFLSQVYFVFVFVLARRGSSGVHGRRCVGRHRGTAHLARLRLSRDLGRGHGYGGDEFIGRGRRRPVRSAARRGAELPITVMAACALRPQVHVSSKDARVCMKPAEELATAEGLPRAIFTNDTRHARARAAHPDRQETLSCGASGRAAPTGTTATGRGARRTASRERGGGRQCARHCTEYCRECYNAAA